VDGAVPRGVRCEALYLASGSMLLMHGNHVKYHHGKGETIRAKKAQVEIGRPKVM
jgi:hypothetical protein